MTTRQLFLASGLALLVTVAEAAGPQLVVPFTGTRAEASAPNVRSLGTPVRFNAEAMLGLAYRSEVELTLPNATRRQIVFELAQSHGNGIHSWIGYDKQRGTEHRTIVTTGPGGSFGVISTPEGEFRLIPGTGHDWLVDMTAEQEFLPMINLGNDAITPPPPTKATPEREKWYPPVSFKAIPGVNTVAMPKATPTPQYVVDLMFVYTRGLADALGANLMTRLNFLVTRANTAYADSEVAITLRLVQATMVDYSDATSDNTALNAITPVSGGGVGVFSNIETLRAAAGADLVAFARNGSSFGGSGIAWVPTPATAPYMYSVTTGCVLGCESVFIHELGHNMGNKHDRATTAWQGGGDAVPDQGLFPYSFGHVYCQGGTLTCNPYLPPGSGGCASNQQPECFDSSHVNNFSTIMSYFQASTDVVYKFSNPNLTCAAPGGAAQPCGIADGLPNAAYNALSMNNNRSALSSLKSTVVGSNLPGSLQFAATGYSAVESAGTINLAVSRVGGSAGAVSVTYTTTDGSALAGFDYTSTSGNLNWSDGDTANKTITVPILNDGVNENGESFTVALSNPSGTAGVYLGHPSSVSALILSPWPSGGTLPSGWLTPDGSSGAWAAATDQLFEGTHSLRSSNVLAAVQGTYVNSDLTTPSLQFQNGNVGFAYKVSAFPGYGYLELLIDGTVAFSDSDTTSQGWKIASVPITAGTHTLKWRFKNRLDFPCANVSNPTPPANCVDRAWIDAVTLPLVLANSGTALGSSANPSGTGQSVTFTATVTGASGTPTGVVSFRDGGSAIAGCNAAALSGTTATCITSALTAGAHSITARYSGDVTYGSSTSGAVNQTVNAATGPPQAIHTQRADFDGDGKVDILWRNTTTGDVYLWLMNGVSFTVFPLATVPLDWSIVGTGDINGDNKADILWRNTVTGLVYVWLMSGPSITGALIDFVPLNWKIVGFNDFDGDGRADILWRETTTGDVYVWFMNGAILLQARSFGTIPLNFAIVATGDTNNDTRADILWRETTTGAMYLWLMNGTTFTPAYMDTVGLNWQIVGLADFNGDLRADIVWRETGSGLVYVWYLNGSSLSQALPLAAVPLEWEIKGLGNYGTDPRADLLWRNASTGDIYLWSTTGLGTFVSQQVSIIPTVWTIAGP